MNRRQAIKRSRCNKGSNRIDDVFKAIGDRVKPSDANLISGSFRRSAQHSGNNANSSKLRPNYTVDEVPTKLARIDINGDKMTQTTSANSISKCSANRTSVKHNIAVEGGSIGTSKDITEHSDVNPKSHRNFPLHKDGTSTFISLSASDDVNARLTLESYREQIHDMLVSTKQFDVIPLLHRNCFDKVQQDPIEQHFSKSNKDITCTVQATQDLRTEKSTQKRCLRPRRPQTNSSSLADQIQAVFAHKLSCEIKMRVKIQYKSHQHVLSMVNSRKHGKDERQFDQFFQATSLLRARDTGCVVCDISFTDVTYLGAFWRDYINGSLQNALKTVFLTEMMRQTAGDEELDVFVSVDEDDFKKGQLRLLNVLKERESGEYNPYNGVISAGVARLEL